MIDSEAVLDFRIPPKPHFCRVVRDGVAGFARSHGVGDEDLSHFLTALGEALANAIEHSRTGAPIEVEVRIAGDRMVATVRDRGVGFAADFRLPSELPDGIAERGRGLSIMRRCADIFSLRTAPGKGTAVMIGRYLQRVSRMVVGL